MPKWHHRTINPVGFAATEARYEEERKKEAKKEAKKEQAIKKEQVKDRKKMAGS